MKEQAVQYTIRGIPREVDLVLRERAKTQRISINQLIIDELSRATVGRSKVADFSDLVGCWEADEAFDKVLEQQREINPDDWR